MEGGWRWGSAKLHKSDPNEFDWVEWARRHLHYYRIVLGRVLGGGLIFSSMPYLILHNVLASS